MDATVNSKLDPAKITSIYPLLGAVLAVFETFLTIWFFKADGIVERIVAGSLMTAILLVFLLVVLRWNLKKGEESEKPKVEGIGTLNLPDKQVTAEQIKSPEPESYVAPNRSYLINRPPEGWEIKELTAVQWATLGLSLSNIPLPENQGEPKDVVVFETSNYVSIIPLPGTTTIDGRKFLDALEIQIPTRLTIRPLYRAQPPLFVERSLLHNFTLAVSESLGLLTLHKQWSTTIPNTQRQRLVAELSQVVDNAIVNGQEGRSIINNIVVVGIEGDIQDYILIMQYTALKNAEDPEISRNQQILNSLMQSFRPIKVPDPEAMSREFKAKADKNFEELMKHKGKDMFLASLGVCLYRLNGQDLSNIETCLKTMKILKPYQIFAEKIELHDKDLDELWKSLQEAENGNILSFKETLQKAIKIAMTPPSEEPSANGDEAEEEDEVVGSDEQATT